MIDVLSWSKNKPATWTTASAMLVDQYYLKMSAAWLEITEWTYNPAPGGTLCYPVELGIRTRHNKAASKDY